MSCRLTILGSGSSGNCAFIETETTRILVDAGLSGRQIEERLAGIGKTADQLHGILVTHEHSDHVQGLSTLAARHRLPVYSNRLTREAVLLALADSGKTSKAAGLTWRIFESGQRFPVGDLDVEAFSVPHDASDPVGFLVQHSGRCIAFLTDLGHATHLVQEKARQADTIILEANYDTKLLQDDAHRPWSVKQRISGRHGHLSNELAAAMLGDVASERLRHVYLSHLSKDCNRPALAEATIRKKLQEVRAAHVRVTLTHQEKPCATETLETAPQAAPPSLFTQPAA